MMSMGAVLHMTGRINGTDLGGLYKSMPITAGLCVVGAASAIPGLQKRSGMAVTYSRVVELVFVTMLMRYGGEKVSE